MRKIIFLRRSCFLFYTVKCKRREGAFNHGLPQRRVLRLRSLCFCHPGQNEKNLRERRLFPALRSLDVVLEDNVGQMAKISFVGFPPQRLQSVLLFRMPYPSKYSFFPWRNPDGDDFKGLHAEGVRFALQRNKFHPAAVAPQPGGQNVFDAFLYVCLLLSLLFSA